MNQSELYDYIKTNQSNICGITVLKGGEKIYSETWNGYQKDDCTHIMSATKSVVAILIGIAIDKGMIKSVDDKVLGYFPDYVVKRGEKTIYDVSIRHLLTMRAPYKGKGDPWTRVCTSSDWTFASLDFLGGKKGITDEFDYRTVCLQILSGILCRASGVKTADFANEYLFSPLGMARHTVFYAKSAEEHKHFIMDKEPKGNVWFASPDGVGTPGYGLCMSAEDMAKIGQLCLDGGRNIVSKQWIDAMTAPRYVEKDMFRGMFYGYLWWVIHPETNVYAAIGNSGNVIYVNPQLNAAVAVSAYFRPAVLDRIDFIEKILLPSII